MTEKEKFEHWWDNNKQYELDCSTLALMQFHFQYEIFITPSQYPDALQLRFEDGIEVEYKKLKKILGGKSIQLKKATINYGNREEPVTIYTVMLNPKWVHKIEMGNW
jgi:hypothetical protein